MKNLFLLVLCLELWGCSYFRDAHERRQAITHLIQAQADVVETCHIALVKVKEDCHWPTVWPVTVVYSWKKGEPDATFIKLPSIPEMLIP